MHRQIGRLVLALATVAALAGPTLAQELVWHHATALEGEPKYPEGFAHFDYVNPDAPKGGTVRLSELGSFDTFNPVLPEGEVATGLGLVYEMLMDVSLDENSTQYGLIAESVAWPDDYSSVTFRLNPKAKWQDGQPITVEDVIWSFETLVAVNPSRAQYYANVTGAASNAPGEVTFTFDTTGNRELPQIMGQLTVLPKHWWTGTDASGKQRDINASTLELPMGSGPYRIESFTPGQTVTFRRVEDYWAQDLPAGVGQNNFDIVRYEYFRDDTVQFEAFKADQFDWRDENRAARWATEYNFPAVNDGRVIQELFDNQYRGYGVLVGFIPNLRRPQFADPRVRRALNFAFDFEELSRTLFYGQYERINSYYYGIPELSSSGLPTGEELEILESVRDLVPASVFDTEYVNPVAGDSTKLRGNLREALRLLNEAGYTLDGTRLVDASGKQLSFEILLNSTTIEPVAIAFQTNLRQIGIDVSVRSVDSPQYVERLRTRDYDVIYSGWAQSTSPGNEQRDYFSSEAATGEDTGNYGGIADPGVDALIDKLIFADDRETLEAATRALDRVLLANYYLVPSYTLRHSRIARWDRFGQPDLLPDQSIGFPTVWWWDEAKAQKTGLPQ